MLKQLQSYQVIQERRMEELKSDGYLLEHKKSGAKIVLMSNEDDNKVFSIGFRTPPSDNTGVPHILEHSVLCGSKKFPAKDSFVELLKGSLNTFLNAMTYPDKTIYPIASRNEHDFHNLMDIYLDAVLNTNIYENEKIFLQEGWNYKLPSAEDELTYNGVVYNEMKGAFSSPERIVRRAVLNSLFPDTTYSKESGGIPDEITDLTYQGLLDFHTKYYHPSNSFIYLYGDMDMEEKLKWLDETYLSQYDRMETDSEIELQPSFGERVDVVQTYSAGTTESEVDNSFLTYNAVIGTSLDQELNIAFQILQYALLNAPGAVLKQALLDKGIAKDVYGSYDDSLYQPVMTIGLKKSNLESKQEFLDTVHEVLEHVVREGIDPKALLAGINSYEFNHREADFGRMPKGLIYGFYTLQSWLYDDKAPFTHLEANAVFASLRTKMNEGYFEQLIQQYLLQNTHTSFVAVTPDKGLSLRKEEALKSRLKSLQASLSTEEIEQLVQRTKELADYQNAPSTKEQQQVIPTLSIEDIDPQASKLSNTLKSVDGTTIVHHNLYTNGIGYLKLLFNVKEVPEHLQPYLGLLKSVLGYVDTANFKFNGLSNEIHIHSGGISASVGASADARQYNTYKAHFEIEAKILYDKLDFAFDMIEEIVLTSQFHDTKRLYEIISQLKGRLQRSLINSGHSAAMGRSSAKHSVVAAFREAVSGVAFYQWLEELQANYEDRKEELTNRLKELTGMIFRPENLLVSYTADDQGYASLEQHVSKLKAKLYTQEVVKEHTEFQAVHHNEGFKSPSEVQYVVQTGNFIHKGFDYTGSLRVLQGILSLDYLWTNIRAKGGAYGCMTGFRRSGDSYMASYRDPNLEKTYNVYEEMPQYLQNFKADSREMTRYIIGAIQDLDAPRTPYAEGTFSLECYLSNVTEADLQKERDEVLSTTEAHIVNFAPLISAILEEKHRCVIGNESKIEEQRDLFDETLDLIKY
ncbi:Zn-dependent M16 (insulinase) family peptidase [Paenibacillus amylolyticus]|uniref:Zn-dependent M16 (Insulinase) family peptidase n=1 Tax=Paenibacillus amylolyticus TaxID=1451 RepID=A0AAP5H2W9_PAEAM|nr:insulinase family protein [Paenibacillus amylolyticus]MDR6725340.1 Zn-dependent M16 (insulinase) family peptidase [Paenibacillus amylolyticus]